MGYRREKRCLPTWPPVGSNAPIRAGSKAPDDMMGLAVLVLITIGLVAATAAPLELGDIVVVKQTTGNVYVIDAVTSKRTLVAENVSSGLSRVVLDSTGGIITTTRWALGVVRIDPATGIVETIADGPMLQRPFTVALDNSNELLVGDLNSGIVRVDLETGNQEQISTYRDVNDIEVGADGTIYVLASGIVNAGGGRILTIDRQNGQHAVLSEGGMLFNPGDMSLSPGGELIVSNGRSNDLSEILTVDLTTGEQVLLFTFESNGFITHEVQ